MFESNLQLDCARIRVRRPILKEFRSQYAMIEQMTNAKQYLSKRKEIKIDFFSTKKKLTKTIIFMQWIMKESPFRRC